MTRIPSSPFTHGGPADIHHREEGSGPPVLFLHGGWGHAAYPFDVAVDALATRHRCLVPDRVGHGRSTGARSLPPGFHKLAARDMIAYLDALSVGRANLWGHSDGAVIALEMALLAPDRFPAIIAEATHYWKLKPGSRAFFNTAATDPASFGTTLSQVLEQDHGANWREVVAMNARAWLHIAAEARTPTTDLFDGRCGRVQAPVLLLHGARDPRTEPGEFDALAASLSRSEPCVFDVGGHSPHSEPRTASRATIAAAAFLDAAIL